MRNNATRSVGSCSEGVCRAKLTAGQREQELAKGGKVQLLEKQQTELAKVLSKLEAQVDIMAANLTEEQTRIAELDASAKEVRRLPPATRLLSDSHSSIVTT